MSGTVLLFPIPCRSCGKPVKEARRCYAIPTCYACLPAPSPLPIYHLAGRSTPSAVEAIVTLLVQTARVSYGGPDRLDVTRKTGSTLGRVFAPTWATLNPVLEARQDASALRHEDSARADAIERAAWETYVPRFLAEMRESFRRYRPAWDELLHRERIVLCCYCTDPERCHRFILRTLIFPKLRAADGGELAP